jgi:hypothetical protein
MSAPSIGRKFMKAILGLHPPGSFAVQNCFLQFCGGNAQEVRLSDAEPWMARRNGSKFLRSAGKGAIPGCLFFGLLFFGQAQNYKKVILHSVAAL